VRLVSRRELVVNGLDLGRVRLREQRDEVLLVSPLPILDLGGLDEVLQRGSVHRRELVLKDLLLERQLLRHESEVFLREAGSHGERDFGVMHRRHERGELVRPGGENDLAHLLFNENFALLEGGLGGFLFGLLRQFLPHRLLQGVNQLLLVLEDAYAEFLLRRDERFPGQAAVIDAGLHLVQQFDDVLLGHVEGDALPLGHLLEVLDR